MSTGVPQLSRGEAGFAERLHGLVFNKLRFDRAPDLVVAPPRPDDEVNAAVLGAAAYGRKVAVLSGGHSWLAAARGRRPDRHVGLHLDLFSRPEAESASASAEAPWRTTMTDHKFVSIADLGLFTGVPQHENFSRIKDLLPTRAMAPSSKPTAWPQGAAITLPETYSFDGEPRSTEQFLEDTDTGALLVLVDGVVRYERYLLTGGPDIQWLAMSVTKSFTSALVGIALAEGHIASIDDAVSDYVPVRAGSAYDGVSIRHVLQMSSGARWDESYSDPESDSSRLAAVLAGLGTFDDFVATAVGQCEPGTVCRYNSTDTQALGALVTRATGRPLSEYMQEKLCEPLGMESPAYWIVDSTGTETAFAGLNMTARDFARFGELYRNGGLWQGRQIIPAQWVRDSVTVAAAHLEAGRPWVGPQTVDLGYGYQWWRPAGDRGDFAAIGAYNQFVFVDPASRTTIVKLSANRRFGTSELESDSRIGENVALLRAIAARTH
jgi:CubicO group peptidase (beta-lactamase class C family)